MLPLAFEHGGSARCCCPQTETAHLSLLLSSLCSAEALAELWGCKREHWLGRSGIQGSETRCSVSFLVIPLGLGDIDSDLGSVWWFLSWEGQSWEYTEKSIVWRAAVHLLVTTYRELFLFLFNHSKHRHLCWKSQEESLKISWTHRPARALWLLLIRAGVYWQEEIRKLLLLLCMVFLFFREESRLKIWTCSQPNKKSASL